MVPFLVIRMSDVSMVLRAFSSWALPVSTRIVSMPDAAATSAMPEPIVPDPITAIFSMQGMRFPLLLSGHGGLRRFKPGSRGLSRSSFALGILGCKIGVEVLHDC